MRSYWRDQQPRIGVQLIACVIGMPASGKTTIFRKIISEQPNWEVKKFKTLRFMICKPWKLIIFGMYPEEGTFAGTDMLSMAVMPDAMIFLRKWTSKHPEYSILMEGDRFNSSKWFNYLKELELEHKIFVVKANEEQMRMRHNSRNNSQSETFLKTIATKVENIEKQFNTTTLINDDQRHLLSNIAIIKNELGIVLKTKVK